MMPAMNAITQIHTPHTVCVPGMGWYIILMARAKYTQKKVTSAENPSSTLPTRVFLPVSRASCPSVESQKLDSIISTIPQMLYSSSVCQNIHPAAAPSAIPSTVITVG